MKKGEIILIIGAVIGMILAIFNVSLSSVVVSLFLIVLALLYFYLGFALFNGIRLRNIFKSDSYKEIGTWRILTAIGTGIALSMLTIGFMFTVLSYPMTETFLTVGIVLAAIMIILAMIKLIGTKDPFYRNIIIRSIIFIIVAVIFLLLPDSVFATP